MITVNNNHFPLIFAQRLKELRKQKGLSRTELGTLAELHYTHIGRFERGASFPGRETLR